MSRSRLLFFFLLAWTLNASAACTPVRFGYIDQNRPPYYMGDGPNIPEPPGATIDLMRDAVQATFGCHPALVRLPPARLRLALTIGDIDFTPLGEMPVYPPEIAIPRDKRGEPDYGRALGNQLVVLVRARDNIPAGANPLAYFQGKVLGAAQGSAYTARLREQGLTIDDGARDVDRNIEKLKLGRVAGVVVSAVKPEHIDAIVKRYNGEIMQLPQPLVSTRLWLAFNEKYYETHRAQVEALWTWIDMNRAHLGYVMQRYGKD